jgi:hypothetical protein
VLYSSSPSRRDTNFKRRKRGREESDRHNG